MIIMKIIIACDCRELLEALKSFDFEILPSDSISDCDAVITDSFEILKKVRAVSHQTPVIMVADDSEIAIKAMREGFDDVVLKERIEELPSVLERVLEKKKRESSNCLEEIFEKASIGIYVIQDGVFKYVNPKFAELWGYEVEEIIGRSPLDFIHPDDRDAVEEKLKLRIEGKLDTVNYKFKVIRKDGKVRISEVFGSRGFYRGKPAAIGMLIDVTELEEYKRFYEKAQALLFILDKNGRLLDVNPKFAEILGNDFKELIGKTLEIFVHPDDLKKFREFFAAVKSGEVKRDEFRFITRDGKTLWFEVFEWPIFENGKLVRIEGLAKEITRRKILEERLRGSEEKFRKIFENTPNIVGIIDSNGKIIEANPSMVKFLGVNPIGKTIFDVFKENAKRIFEYFKKSLEENRVINFQDSFGNRHFITTVIPTELGGKKHLILIARDVSELVILNRLLRAIAHIRDEQTLLKRVCEELSPILTVTICLVERDGIRPVAAAGDFDKVRNCKLLREPAECDGKCPECEIKGEIKQAFSIPMEIDGEFLGIFAVHSTTEEISDEMKEILRTFAKDLALALKSIEACRQIEHNISQFATLIDRIRNPLAIIQALAELNLDEKTAKIIIEQVAKINEVLRELDECWEKSEMIVKSATPP